MLAVPRGARVAGIAALSILGGCAGYAEPMRPDALAGCWYFETGEDVEPLRLPWGVELTLEPLEGWPAVEALGEAHRAITLTPSGRRDFPFAYWRPSPAGDSLVVGHPAGGGVDVDVAVPPRLVAEAVLRGSARPVGDALGLDGSVPDTAARPVRLTRARCPDPASAGWLTGSTSRTARR